MATRKVRLGCTVTVPDDSKSAPALKDANGVTFRPALVGTRNVPAGELVELDAEEADRLERLHPFVPRDIEAAAETPERDLRAPMPARKALR